MIDEGPGSISGGQVGSMMSGPGMITRQQDESNQRPQYSMPGILHFLQTEWARFEMERSQWEVERAELQVKILVTIDVRWLYVSAFCLEIQTNKETLDFCDYELLCFDTASAIFFMKIQNGVHVVKMCLSDSFYIVVHANKNTDSLF